MITSDWQSNEMQQVGTDYNSVEEVAAYDRRMGEFRDVTRENAEMLGMLDLAPGAAVLEIGCGTGRFARAAAAAGLRATAVDVSATMLVYVRQCVQEEGLSEIAMQHAGFLTMEFPPESFDAAVSGAALHHLPDAMRRMRGRRGGRLPCRSPRRDQGGSRRAQGAEPAQATGRHRPA